MGNITYIVFYNSLFHNKKSEVIINNICTSIPAHTN